MVFATAAVAMGLVREAGCGCLMAKIDWKSAYRQILVRPEDLHLLGFFFEGAFYVDTRLPFGLRSSAGIHGRYAELLTWIYERHVEGLRACNFADDHFLVTGHSLVPAEARIRKDKADEITGDLGVEAKDEKGVDNAVIMVFVGVGIQSVSYTSNLHLDRRLA